MISTGVPTQPRLKRGFTAAGLSVVVFVAWTRLGIGGSVVVRAFDDLALLVAAGAAGVACLGRSRHAAGRDRGAWLLLSLSCLSWAAGQMTWAYYQDLLGQPTPFPSAADAGFVLSMPLAGWGVLQFAPFRTRVSRVRSLLDGFLVAGSFACLSWFSALERAWQADYDGVLAKGLALAYPLGTAVAACLVVVVLARCGRERFSLLLVGSSILTLSLTNTAYAYLLADAHYYTGHPIDVGWLVSFLLLALAARVPPGSPNDRAEDDPQPLWSLLVPYVPVILVAVLTAVTVAAGVHLDSFMTLAVVALTILVLVRHCLTIIEQKRVEAELRATARRLNEAQELAHIGSWERDLDTGRLFWSDELYRIMGITRGSVVPTLESHRQTVHPEDRPIFDAGWDAVTRNQPLDVQYRVVLADGSMRWVRSRSSASSDRSYGCTRRSGTLEDVTERKRADDSLRFQARLLEAVAQAVIATDPDGSIIYWNSAAEKLYGWTAEEILGRHVLELVPPEAVDEAGVIMAGLAMGESWSGDFWMRRRDGSRFPAFVTDTPVLDGTGALVAIIGTSSDVSERLRAHDQLRASEERFRRLVEASPLAILELDSQGQATPCNAAAEATLGSHGRLNGTGRVDLNRYPALDEVRSRVTRGERVPAHDLCVTGGDGVSLHLEVAADALRNGTGEVTGAILVAADITARKSLENQLLQAQKLEAVGRLAGGIAHDFNNLLTIVLSYSVLLLDSVGDDVGVRPGLEAIQRAAERAATLTSRLLTFSRTRTRTRTVIDVNEAVLSLNELLARTLDEDINLEVTTDAAAGSVAIEPSEFDQVMLNLVVNARDAMSSGGTLHIATSRLVVNGGGGGSAGVQGGEYVVLTVSDTGSGMDARTAANCFEPFFTTKRVGKGTGLGLASVYGIVSGVGGHIRVESSPGKGTVFTILVPAVAAAAVPEPCPVAPPQTPDARDRTVLLVEDEEEVLTLAAGILRRTGYRVLTACNGKQALAALGDDVGLIDVLVTDVVMPELGGVDLAKELVRRNPRLEVVFISGYTDRALPPLRTGERPWLVEKPFHPDALISTVGEALRAKTPVAGAEKSPEVVFVGKPARQGARPANHCSPEHVVEFYETEEFLIDTVRNFLSPVLDGGDVAIVVATAAHGSQFERALRASGVDVDGALAGDRYQRFDASQLLETFMVDGAPDPASFLDTMGQLIDRAAAGGRRVQIYGEMVALLCEAGDSESAMALEDLWNDLAATHEFSLLCAYPMRAFEEDASAATFNRICEQHSTVVPTEAYSLLGGTDEQQRAVAALQQQLAALRVDLERRRLSDRDNASVSA